VPGAGGNVIGFYSLIRRLGTDRPVYGLQARGMDGEAAPHTSIEEMAACYVAAMREVQPEGPYLLCGHSFGSWVAFEIAQQLQRQGQRVELLALFNSPTPLVISDHPAYRHESRGQHRDDLTMLLVVARSLERAFSQDLAVSREGLQELSPEERIVYLTEQLKRVNILPAEADTKHVRGFVNVFKTNYAITYNPRDCVPTPIVLFRAANRFAEDTDVPPVIRDDPAWGWNEFAKQPVAVHVIPGEHQTMLNEPHVETLAEQLGAYLR
jgi:thioesterase domain-containing protein